MKRVEIVTPRGEVLWSGPEDMAANGLGLLSLGLTIREEGTELVEVIAVPLREPMRPRSLVTVEVPNEYAGRKVRVRVEVVE